MVSLEDSHSNSARFPLPRDFSPSTSKIHCHTDRSMRTIRSNLNQNEGTCSFSSGSVAGDRPEFISENLTDSVVDMRLGELAARYNGAALAASAIAAKGSKPATSEEELRELSQASDFLACSSDISGELQRFTSLPMSDNNGRGEGGAESDPNLEDFFPA